MPEYTATAAQTVAARSNVLFTETPVPCCRGYVIHREGAGIFTLRGIVNNGGCFARYKVSFGGNVAIPTGGTVAPISIAIAINGEALPSTTAISTPAAVAELNNVFTEAFITVPKGCCYTVSIQNTGADPITVQNANLIIERVA